jgi:ribosomal 50S subunit-recycling heat shock protein
MSEPLTYESEHLIHEWRERFTGRRTVAYEMLEQAEVLVREAVARELATVRREDKTQREWDLERRERAVELAEREKDRQVDRLRRQLAEAEAKVASMSPRMTLMREERETVEDGTIVRLLAPRVPSYGDKESPRPWMLGEIEDVVHRLRMGGGEDSTELRFKRDAIEACVPFAEFALTPAPRALPERRPPLPNPVVLEGGVHVDWRLVVGLLVVVLSVVVGTVIL